MLRTRLMVWLVLALTVCVTVAVSPAHAQSPRTTDGPKVFDFATFSQRLLQTQPLISDRNTHFVLMVDVSASVGNLMLGSWRSGLYEPMLENFMVAGDQVSVVPFGLHPWFDDARFAERYARQRRAHLYTSTFPTVVKAPKYKGTDIYGSVAEVLERTQKSGAMAHDNMVVIVVTDDQIEDASEKANKRFQALRSTLLASASDVMRCTWVGPRGNRDFTVMVFTNAFPDAKKLAAARTEQVARERAAPGGGGSVDGSGAPDGASTGGAAGAGGGSGSNTGSGSSTGAAGSPGHPEGVPGTTGGTGGLDGSGAPSGSPGEGSGTASAEAAHGFWPPPWWFWAVLGVGALALIAALANRPRGMRYTIDGAPGKMRPGDRPIEVKAGSERVGELRLARGGLLFHVGDGFVIESAPASIAKPRGGASRGAAPAPVNDVLLRPGRNGAFETYPFDLVRKAPASSSWSAAPITAGDVRVHVEVAVADLEAGAQSRTQQPPRVGAKGGGNP